MTYLAALAAPATSIDPAQQLLSGLYLAAGVLLYAAAVLFVFTCNHTKEH